MNFQYLPSPPLSPFTELGSNISFESAITDTDEPIRCGGCNRELGTDWFCSDCHRKCGSCNRFLAQEDEYCTRCWIYDPVHRQYHRKQHSVFIQYYYQSSENTVTQGNSNSVRGYYQCQQQYYQQASVSSNHRVEYEYGLDSDFTGLPSPSNSTGSETTRSSSTISNTNKFSFLFNRKKS